eukprot:4018685-Prymnesium_polylepis.2
MSAAFSADIGECVHDVGGVRVLVLGKNSSPRSLLGKLSGFGRIELPEKEFLVRTQCESSQMVKNH